MGYEPDEKDVALRAWCMYEVNPTRHGHDQTHWFEARRQLIREKEMAGRDDRKKTYEEVSGAITNIVEGRPGPADWEIMRNAEIAAQAKASERRRAMLKLKDEMRQDREKRWSDFYAARDAGFRGEYEEFVALREAGKEVPTGQPLSIGEKVLDRLGRFLRHLTG